MEKNPTPRSDFFMPGSESQRNIQKEKQPLQAVRQRITLQVLVETLETTYKLWAIKVAVTCNHIAQRGGSFQA